MSRVGLPGSIASLGPSLLLGSCLALAAPGCASPCTRIADSHAAYFAATKGTPANSPAGAHATVSVPNEVLDALVARELADVPRVTLPLPEVAGYSLGKLNVGIDAVRLRDAPAGEVGVRVTVGLRAGTRAVTRVNLDARVHPTLDPREGTLTVAMAGRDIVGLEASLDESGRKSLGNWLWTQLPAAAKVVLDRDSVQQIAGDLAAQLADDAAALVERELLDDLGELVHFELDLPPELPIASISVRSGSRYLDLDLRTPLAVQTPLPEGRARAADLHPNLIQVRLSGDAAAALVNAAIASGRIPDRWNLDGEPDPDGAIRAALGWVEGVDDPLAVHLWSLAGDCAHVRLRGQPILTVAEGSGPRALEVGARDAKVESVSGSLKVRAGLFFDRTARRGISLVEQTAAATEVDVGGAAMQLSIYAADIRGDEVVLGLRLTPRR